MIGRRIIYIKKKKIKANKIQIKFFDFSFQENRKKLTAF